MMECPQLRAVRRPSQRIALPSRRWSSYSSLFQLTFTCFHLWSICFHLLCITKPSRIHLVILVFLILDSCSFLPTPSLCQPHFNLTFTYIYFPSLPYPSPGPASIPSTSFPVPIYLLSTLIFLVNLVHSDSSFLTSYPSFFPILLYALPLLF